MSIPGYDPRSRMRVALRDYMRRHVALPADHGSWLLLLGPLVIGIAAAPARSWATLYLAAAALCGFLARQPITLAVKAYSGRRSRDVLPAAWFWITLYGALAAGLVALLVARGHGYVLVLALPGVPVFAWYLVLVARRAERRQQLVELVAAGVLALAAPAAYWIGAGAAQPVGWWLWAAVWALTAPAIVHAYLRLEQRALSSVPGWSARLRMGAASLLCSAAALVAVFALGRAGILPPWLFAAHALQGAESLYGVARPAVGLKPKAIGWRQLAVSAAATLVFIVAWR